MQKNVMGWLVLKCLPGFDNCSYSSQPRKSLRQINHETQLIAPVIFHIHFYGSAASSVQAQRGCAGRRGWQQRVQPAPAEHNASSKEGKMGSSFVTGLNICGMNPPKAFSARADPAWDRWLMVSRAFGPKGEAGSILMLFPAQGEDDSASPSAAVQSAALGGSWIQSGAAGATAGLTKGFNGCGTQQSSLLCKSQEASFGFGCFFI